MTIRIPVASKPMFDLAIQIAFGAIVFVLIGLVALSLAWFAHWLEMLGAPPWLVNSTRYLEIGLYGLDVFCSGLFVLNEARRFVRKLDWKS